jgi:hypothetical protein
LSEGRAGQQGQNGGDGKNSIQFHFIAPSLSRIQRPARGMTATDAPQAHSETYSGGEAYELMERRGGFLGAAPLDKPVF